jgi:MoaA/NifB/PqqE/SkfB family radical SAM enzyme
MILVIFITQNCNFSCGHCLNKCPIEEEIDIKVYEDIINLLSQKGLKYIIFTGGEPILHTKFEKIIDITEEKGISFKIFSNGFLYEKYKFLLESEKFDFIYFSVEGLEENHDRNRKSGSFKRVIEAINFFQNKIKIGINFTITKHSYNEYEEVIKYFSKFNIEEINLSSVISNKINKNLVLDIGKKRNILYWTFDKMSGTAAK